MGSRRGRAGLAPAISPWVPISCVLLFEPYAGPAVAGVSRVEKNDASTIEGVLARGSVRPRSKFFTATWESPAALAN